MPNTSHLIALQARLSHEREYLKQAKSDRERQLRAVWIAQIEREIEQECVFLGIPQTVECDLTDDELLNELRGLE